jgi:hypothetical protein
MGFFIIFLLRCSDHILLGLPAFSAAAASPLDNDRAGNHQTEEDRHRY